MDHPQQRAGIIAGLTAYVVWGLLTIYWKQLHAFDAFELIGWRITAAAVLMVAVVAVINHWAQLRAVFVQPRLLARVALAAALLTVNWTCYVYAVVHGHVLETALGYFIAPIGTVLVGVLVLHEPMRRAQTVSLLFAVASVVVLTVSYGRPPWLALLIAVSWVCYGYLKRQITLTPVESMAAESWLLAPLAVVVLLVTAQRDGSVPDAASALEWVYVLLTGVATVVPLLLFAYAAPRVRLTVIGPMMYIVPSMNFLIGWLLYDETLPPTRVVGFALVWVGLAVLTADTWRRARTVSAPAVEPAC